MLGSRAVPAWGWLLSLLATLPASAECVLFSDAHQHIGRTQCVRGTIFNVKEGSKGVTFLDFCENFDTCPFTVVVFADDLKHVGDVRQLKGRTIEVNGTVQDYDGRAEIILRHPRQLGKDAILVPPLPKNYDVERRGKYSPGKFKYPKAANKKPTKKQGRPVNIEDPSESQ
jgi:DNA/RNA endonuclease YhcR with UshA esterase domain